MSGINWKTVGKATFEKIAEILLRREFGLRGHAVDGRGGDGGIDYDVDDAKMIFQLKYFPEGFPTRSSRPAQIEKSFKEAISPTQTSGSWWCRRMSPRQSENS